MGIDAYNIMKKLPPLDKAVLDFVTGLRNRIKKPVRNISNKLIIGILQAQRPGLGGFSGDNPYGILRINKTLATRSLRPDDMFVPKPGCFIILI